MKNCCLILMTIVSMVQAVYGQNVSKKPTMDSLLARMTLEEKIGQMNQYSSFYDVTGPASTNDYIRDRYLQLESGLVGSVLNVKGVDQVREMQQIAVEKSRLGIPLIFGYDVIHGYKTTFPIPLAEAASWDMEAIEKSARVAAVEAAAAGLNWTFAPMVDISRDARWGRVMEGAGEDPCLGSMIAKARVNGFQGDDLAAPNTIAACAKHFAAYGFAESGKDYNTADIGLSTLYNIVLPPFKAAADANVLTFMNAFNELNGIPATADYFLQRELLKGDWGFNGFIVSDWGSITEMIAHGYAEDGKHAAELAVNAGSDMDMESNLYVTQLKTLITEGKVDIATIDDAARRILYAKEALGLFDDPYKYCDDNREKEMIGHKDHLDAAKDVAKKSIVLLKNEDSLLPLKKEGQRIAIIGPLADDKNSPLGNWRLGADEHSAVSLVEGMEQYPSSNNLSFSKGVTLIKNEPQFHSHCDINMDDRTGIEAAVATAKAADVVLMVVGEYGLQSGEGRSRSSLGLPGLQQALLEAVYEVNKNIVLVLMNGRPLAISWADEHIPAILETWHLGTQSGHAIAEVLYGDYNPSGKLPMTFPRDVGQVPIYYNIKSSGRPGPKKEVFWSHYTDQTNAPLYPFGYGLSYTSFEYNQLEANYDQATKTVKVTVQLTNTGEVKGKETVQLYIHDKVASVTRPIKELKAFHQVELEGGASRQVEFMLTEKDLGFFNNQGRYVVEPGAFELMVGTNSSQTLHTSFVLK